ncbi:MAG: protein kinase, partial [Myxococcota bacterium]
MTGPGGWSPSSPGLGPRYQLVRRIGVGGMAELFLARATDGPLTGQLVAIKRILPAFSDNNTFVGMFRDEARISSELRHPNVVRTFEVSTRGDDLYLVMEFLDGETVRSILRALPSGWRAVPVPHAVRIAIGVADGLHHAHERSDGAGRPLRLVHRDVSPQNVMVTVDGAVKVLDFGIAKVTNRVVETHHGTMKGKIPYMSPEQTAGEALDRRSDVYAIGVILYELTVGRRPYKADSDFGLIRQIQEQPIPRPTESIRDYPPELEAIVLKALARRRGQRYQTAAELAADLRRFAIDRRLDLSPGALAPLLATVRSVSQPGTDETPRDPDRVVVSALPVPSTDAAITERRVGDAWLVTIAGRLTERFDGVPLAGRVDGVVVIDLSAVDRVTSFGVREWLATMAALTGRVSALYLARCSSAIVNQLTMIGGFAGPGAVVSFRAPYQCRACGHGFERLIDGLTDQVALAGGTPPAARCPRCAEAATFDDDPGFFRTVAGLVVTAVVPAAEVALRALDDGEPPAVEKRVVPGRTELVVHGAVDRTIRWARILDGIEGPLVV